MPEEQQKCMAAGANDYLTKPVDIERLLTLLRVLLFSTGGGGMTRTLTLTMVEPNASNRL